MLKINLLPPYIFERRKVRQTAFLFGLIFMLTFGGMVAWWYTLGKKEADLKEQLVVMNQRKDQVLALENTIKAEEAKIPPIKERMDYFRAVMAYNTKFPELYEELAKYTYERILYRSIQPSNNSLTIQAHAKSIGDAGRYLLNMYRARHLFSGVQISAVPGYPSNLLAGFDFTVTCSLVNPIDPPAVPGSLGGGTVESSASGGGSYSTPSGSSSAVSSESSLENLNMETPKEEPPPGWGGG
mgnify:CR=1 FL=1